MFHRLLSYDLPAVRGRLKTVKKQSESGISDSEPASVLQA